MPRSSSWRMRASSHGGDLRGAATGAADVGELRIIGGQFRGRKLRYTGDPRTRPMKDRVREAAFNLLGPGPVGKHALDLFAGTGALGLEAISRGALNATLIERHFPTAAVLRENAVGIGCEARVRVIASDTYYWVRHALDLEKDAPWLVFCSPPYEHYVERADEILELLATLIKQAPGGSLFVVESDARFAAERLPHAADWTHREYPPAHLYRYRTPPGAPAADP